MDFPPHLISDTFQKVRCLLRHEVNFAREQKSLLEARTLYKGFPGVRVPRLTQALCTAGITAMTEERGIKVTSAAAHLPVSRRRRVAEQLVEALVVLPLFATAEKAIFHGDPHAGNLLYDNRAGELTILDWALHERLDRDQRRHIALMFLLLTLRDPVGVSKEVVALSQDRTRLTSRQRRVLRETVARFLDDMPPSRLPGGVDTMRLLENVAMNGIKFPSSLIMFRKVMFIMQGILGDIAGSDPEMGFTLAPHLVQHWFANRTAFRSPLRMRDWLTLHASSLLYSSRVWLQWERGMLNRWLKTP